MASCFVIQIEISISSEISFFLNVFVQNLPINKPRRFHNNEIMLRIMPKALLTMLDLAGAQCTNAKLHTFCVQLRTVHRTPVNAQLLNSPQAC